MQNQPAPDRRSFLANTLAFTSWFGVGCIPEWIGQRPPQDMYDKLGVSYPIVNTGHLSPKNPDLTPEMLSEFLHDDRVPNINDLRFHGHRGGKDWWARMVDLMMEHPKLQGLKSLTIYGHRFTDEAMIQLAHRPLLSRLNILSISSTKLGKLGLKTLGQTKLNHGLELALDYGEFKGAGVELSRLRVKKLSLTESHLTGDDASSLLANTQASFLDLTANPMNGMRPIQFSPALTYLIMEYGGFTNVDLMHLATIEAKGLKNLVMLDRFSPDAVLSLKAASWLPQLDYLSIGARIRNPAITDPIEQELAAHTSGRVSVN